MPQSTKVVALFPQLYPLVLSMTIPPVQTRSP
jgi:hypothetical protein